MSQAISTPTRPRASRGPAGEHRRPVIAPARLDLPQAHLDASGAPAALHPRSAGSGGHASRPGSRRGQGRPAGLRRLARLRAPEVRGLDGDPGYARALLGLLVDLVQGDPGAPLDQPAHLLRAQHSPPLEGCDPAADGDDGGVLRPGAAEGQDRLGGGSGRRPRCAAGRLPLKPLPHRHRDATATTSTSAPTASAGARSGGSSPTSASSSSSSAPRSPRRAASGTRRSPFRSARRRMSETGPT